MTMTVKEFISLVKEKQSLYKYTEGLKNSKLTELDKYRKQRDYLTDIMVETENVIQACKLILEKITYNNKVLLEGFITNALRNIFTDRDYSIIINIRDDLKQPAINILLEENGIEQEIRDSVGGGIITALGFLFQIYYLEVYGLNKIMFIDEGLKEISKTDKDNINEDYLNNLLRFLKVLSEERGYKFVIITHDDSITELADTVYKVKTGEVIKITD